MTKALCFDQSTTNTGWAFGDENSDPRKGSNRPFYSGVIVAPKREEMGERLAYIFRQAMILIETHEPDIIGYEEPYFPHQGAGAGNKKKFVKGKPTGFISNGNSAAEQDNPDGHDAEKSRFNPDMLKKLQMVKGIILTVAALRSIPVAPCTPSQWRVTFLGYGRKPAGEADDFMKHMARQRARALGHDVTSFDECDAIGIHYHTLHGKAASARAQGSLLDLAGGSL